MFENFIYVAMTVLMPLLPAYILYRTLPSKTAVSGPFKGLRVRLSGAFAAYFLLVLVILGFIVRPRTDSNLYEVWRVSGQLAFADSEPSDGRGLVKLSMVPPPVELDDVGGHFWMDVLVKPGPGGALTFPFIRVEQSGFEPESIPLDGKSGFVKSYRIEYDQDKKEIKIVDPIRLQKRRPIPTAQPAHAGPLPGSPQ